MCLITEQKEPIITTEDIIVYKVLTKHRYGYISVFFLKQPKIYLPGTLYKTEMMPTNSIACFDSKVERAYDVESSKLTHIGPGFHFLTFTERFNPDRLIYDLSIVECIIPKGSEVYYDATGLGVANQIILKSEV